jgi:hypothetical protein
MDYKLKIGDLVKMVNCLEAEDNKHIVWTVRSEPWDLCGTEVVLLEGKRRVFDTSKLKLVGLRVNDYEI